jgi:hypothetical protein
MGANMPALAPGVAGETDSEHGQMRDAQDIGAGDAERQEIGSSIFVIAMD